MLLKINFQNLFISVIFLFVLESLEKNINFKISS
jgi:hypothetical protein